MPHRAQVAQVRAHRLVLQIQGDEHDDNAFLFAVHRNPSAALALHRRTRPSPARHHCRERTDYRYPERVKHPQTGGSTNNRYQSTNPTTGFMGGTGQHGGSDRGGAGRYAR
jgi:hypothetical protein